MAPDKHQTATRGNTTFSDHRTWAQDQELTFILTTAEFFNSGQNKYIKNINPKKPASAGFLLSAIQKIK